MPVIDAESLKMIQLLRLHQAIDHTLSATGSAVLLRSLIQPSTSLTYIQSKQHALREIASSDKLRQALVDAVSEFSRGETALYKFFNKGLLALFPYRDLKRARQSAEVLAHIVSTLPRAFLGRHAAHRDFLSGWCSCDYSAEAFSHS